MYISGNLAASSASLYSPRDESAPESPRGGCMSREGSLEEEERLYSAGPEFVDNLDDDLDDEKMLVGNEVRRGEWKELYALSSQDPLVDFEGVGTKQRSEE